MSGQETIMLNGRRVCLKHAREELARKEALLLRFDREIKRLAEAPAPPRPLGLALDLEGDLTQLLRLLRAAKKQAALNGVPPGVGWRLQDAINDVLYARRVVRRKEGTA